MRGCSWSTWAWGTVVRRMPGPARLCVVGVGRGEWVGPGEWVGRGGLVVLVGVLGLEKSRGTCPVKFPEQPAQSSCVLILHAGLAPHNDSAVMPLHP